MPQVPKILLLWVGEGSIEPKSSAFAESGEKDKNVFYGKQEPKSSRIQAMGRLRQGARRDRHRPFGRADQGGDQSYGLVQAVDEQVHPRSGHAGARLHRR
jgi:glycerophosphoryl diester phosphodiesterase